MLHEIQPGDVVIVTVAENADLGQAKQLAEDIEKTIGDVCGAVIRGTETSVHVIRAKAEAKVGAPSAKPEPTGRRYFITKCGDCWEWDGSTGWWMKADGSKDGPSICTPECFKHDREVTYEEACAHIGAGSPKPRETWPAWRDVKVEKPLFGAMVLGWNPGTRCVEYGTPGEITHWMPLPEGPK